MPGLVHRAPSRSGSASDRPMIVKDPDPISSTSPRAQAGARAEQNMAFYLRRAFGDHRDGVWVFNDIRVKHDEETAQIDHLVLHTYGMFIIESKSVSGEIQILPDGQFIRHFGHGRKEGMPSPVAQAQRQADLLRRLLQANKASIRDRAILGLLQGGFTHCPMEIRVAISDSGIIRGANHAPEVQKADRITQDIEGRLAAHRRGASLLNLDLKNPDGMYRFTAGELEKLQRFLLEQHRPFDEDHSHAKAPERPAPVTRSEASQPAPQPPRPSTRPSGDSARTMARSNVSQSAATPAPPSEPAPVRFLCSKCQSLELRIEFGKFGYYLKCQECGGNTRIDTRIDATERRGRIRKSGNQFHLVCPETGTERLLYVNPPEPSK